MDHLDVIANALSQVLIYVSKIISGALSLTLNTSNPTMDK